MIISSSASFVDIGDVIYLNILNETEKFVIKLYYPFIMV